jgi:hypothetical protein
MPLDSAMIASVDGTENAFRLPEAACLASIARSVAGIADLTPSRSIWLGNMGAPWMG